MLTEQSLVAGEVNASDDMDGLNTLIQNIFNEIAKKRVKVIMLHRDKKSQDAIELHEMANDMSSELDSLIKTQMNYLKYLKAIGQTGKNEHKSLGKLSAIKTEKSSNGSIVQEIPKH